MEKATVHYWHGESGSVARVVVESDCDDDHTIVFTTADDGPDAMRKARDLAELINRGPASPARYYDDDPAELGFQRIHGGH